MQKIATLLSREFLEKNIFQEKIPLSVLSANIGVSKFTIIKYCKRHDLYERLLELRKNKIYEKDLIGTVCKSLTVISPGPRDRHGRARWNCQCVCGRTKLINETSIRAKLSATCGWCERVNFKGYKEISGSWWRRQKQSAELREYVFNITLEDVWTKYEKQKRKCALSGVDIIFIKNNDVSHLQTASIDRIDNTKGYTVDNIQIVHKHVNFMKGTHSQIDFINWARLIYETNKKDDT